MVYLCISHLALRPSCQQAGQHVCACVRREGPRKFPFNFIESACKYSALSSNAAWNFQEARNSQSRKDPEIPTHTHTHLPPIRPGRRRGNRESPFPDYDRPRGPQVKLGPDGEAPAAPEFRRLGSVLSENRGGSVTIVAIWSQISVDSDSTPSHQAANLARYLGDHFRPAGGGALRSSLRRLLSASYSFPGSRFFCTARNARAGFNVTADQRGCIQVRSA